MKDRVSANPGRYKITFEDTALGTKHAVLELDDNPSVMGTPLNAATLCSNELLSSLGLDDNATPTDAFNAVLERIADTGWRSLWTNNDPNTDASVTAKAYADNKVYAPEYRKVGSVVYLRGTVSAKTTITAGRESSIIVGTLPTNMRPSKNVYTVIHGSSLDIALLTIHKDGKIKIERHAHGGNYADFTPSSWLTINASFMLN